MFPLVNLFIPSVHSSDTVNFRVLSPGWSHPFLHMPTQFYQIYQLSTFVNLFIQSAYSSDTGTNQGVEKGCTRNEWVNDFFMTLK